MRVGIQRMGEVVGTSKGTSSCAKSGRSKLRKFERERRTGTKASTPEPYPVTITPTLPKSQKWTPHP
eukprot:768539-Hanusia_phi.AAC.2